MLTVFEDSDNIFNAICAGATGYLLKKTPPAQIIESIKDALNGGSPMSSPIARKVVNFFKEFVPPDSSKKENLTDREKEILNGLSKGLSYKTIGESLFISVDTVRYHITKIYKKLHVHSQSEAVAKAIKKGFLTILTTISYVVNI
jgi:DNA-binding NarL/FixJ family response regulator